MKDKIQIAINKTQTSIDNNDSFFKEGLAIQIIMENQILILTKIKGMR